MQSVFTFWELFVNETHPQTEWNMEPYMSILGGVDYANHHISKHAHPREQVAFIRLKTVLG